MITPLLPSVRTMGREGTLYIHPDFLCESVLEFLEEKSAAVTVGVPVGLWPPGASHVSRHAQMPVVHQNSHLTVPTGLWLLVVSAPG